MGKIIARIMANIGILILILILGAMWFISILT